MHSGPTLDMNRIRKDFPILQTEVYNKPLVYLDNGATTQKPQVVIDTIREIQEKHNSSIHRGIHYLSEEMTSRYEAAREQVRRFINAESSKEVIFTSGATGSINAIAFSFGEAFIKEGDEILISEMEHHANIVPWQMLCERKGATLRVLPFDEQGILELDHLDRATAAGSRSASLSNGPSDSPANSPSDRLSGNSPNNTVSTPLLNEKTRLVALTHASNTLATINPVKEIIRKAHERGIPVLIDGSQMVQHGKVDVQELDCDFYVFSGHKIYAPTGIGVLYGKEEWLEKLPPYQGGGDMVDQVSFTKTTYNELPFKFEAGTTNYTGAIGLATALNYIQSLGIEAIAAREHELGSYTMEKFEQIEGLRIYGQASERISLFSFLLEGVHSYDAGMILDKMGIAVRTGTHCNQPVMDHFGIAGTIRASLVFYNTKEEIDALVAGIIRTQQMLS